MKTDKKMIGVRLKTEDLSKNFLYLTVVLVHPVNRPLRLSSHRTRDGHVRFWRAPVSVPSLCHLCRSALRFSVSTQQIEALPLPKRIVEYLTYKNIPERLRNCGSSSSSDEEEDWESWGARRTLISKGLLLVFWQKTPT